MAKVERISTARARETRVPVIEDIEHLGHVVVPLDEVPELKNMVVGDSVLVGFEGEIVRIVDAEGESTQYGMDIKRFFYADEPETLESEEERINRRTD